MKNINIIKGNILTSISKKQVQFLPSGFMAFGSNGTILEVSEKDIREKYNKATFQDFSDKLILPGFVDTHNHLSQLGLEGIYKGELLEWLNELIFPRERKMEDTKYAKKISELFFRELLRNGITTTSTYVSNNKNATNIAFEAAAKAGIRANIGNVLMDQNAPEYLVKNTDTMMRESEQLIKKWHGFDDRLHYAITPRFAIACSFDLLKRAAELAHKYDLGIQTHLAENENELQLVKKYFPDKKNYTDVYYQAGLLGNKTVVAHCIYLNAAERKILKKTGTKISHCPSSNRFLISGLMPYREYEKEKLPIALGTDISAGYNLSILDEMKEAIETSKMINFVNGEKTHNPISAEEAFYLGTLGGATALGLGEIIGSLEKGKSADFIILNPEKSFFNIDNDFFANPHQILAKIIYAGNRQIIDQVFIRGIEVEK